MTHAIFLLTVAITAAALWFAVRVVRIRRRDVALQDWLARQRQVPPATTASGRPFDQERD